MAEDGIILILSRTGMGKSTLANKLRADDELKFHTTTCNVQYRRAKVKDWILCEIPNLTGCEVCETKIVFQKAYSAQYRFKKIIFVFVPRAGRLMPPDVQFTKRALSVLPPNTSYDIVVNFSNLDTTYMSAFRTALNQALSMNPPTKVFFMPDFAANNINEFDTSLHDFVFAESSALADKQPHHQKTEFCLLIVSTLLGVLLLATGFFK